MSAFPTRNADAALFASVLSRAMPMEPPTCWDVFTRAEATPASSSLTPAVATFMAGAMISPSPRPVKISCGMMWVPYTLSAWMRVSHASPIEHISMPIVTGIFAPMRGNSTMFETCAVVMTPATIGRNATPVRTGEKCRVCCR